MKFKLVLHGWSFAVRVNFSTSIFMTWIAATAYFPGTNPHWGQCVFDHTILSKRLLISNQMSRQMFQYPEMLFCLQSPTHVLAS